MHYDFLWIFPTRGGGCCIQNFADTFFMGVGDCRAGSSQLVRVRRGVFQRRYGLSIYPPRTGWFLVVRFLRGKRYPVLTLVVFEGSVNVETSLRLWLSYVRAKYPAPASVIIGTTSRVPLVLQPCASQDLEVKRRTDEVMCRTDEAQSTLARVEVSKALTDKITPVWKSTYLSRRLVPRSAQVRVQEGPPRHPRLSLSRGHRVDRSHRTCGCADVPI
jgi:hypothetical protein